MTNRIGTGTQISSRLAATAATVASATSSGVAASGADVQPVGHLGLHEAGTDDEHPGPGAAQRLAEAEVEAVEPGLGRAVDEVRAAYALAGHARQRDDHAVRLVPEPVGEQHARGAPGRRS